MNHGYFLHVLFRCSSNFDRLIFELNDVESQLFRWTKVEEYYFQYHCPESCGVDRKGLAEIQS